MSRSSDTRLYPDMEDKSNDHLARDVIESYWENRRLHEQVDAIKEKCIKFVHQEQYDEEVELERTAYGLPSMVVDKTFSVWKTLDGYARRNRIDIKFVPVGDDDYDEAELHNKIFQHITNTQELHHYQSEAYGLAAITDEAYIHIHPEWDSTGRLNPCFVVPDSFECYPDANFKRPIDMSDAEFIDFPQFMLPRSIMREYEAFMAPEFRGRFEEYHANQTTDDKMARNTYKNRSGQHVLTVNGMTLLIRRYYKKFVKKRFLLNTLDQSVAEIPEEEEQLVTKAIAETMGYELMKIPMEELWTCIVVPDVTDKTFLMNEKTDFQPINPTRLGQVRWPVVRFVHTHVAGKAIGAIRGLIKMQEARNLILSSLLHHIQTAANGGMLTERGAFGGDQDQKDKFDNHRNRAGITITVADGALKEKRIQPIPRGEFAARDAGDWLEGLLIDAIKDFSGAEPVMKGQAQKGAPASLFQMQVEQSQNQLLSSSEYFRQSQNLMAEIIQAFTRQFFTEERVFQIEGIPGERPEKLVINQQTAGGVLNDPSYGLYTVYKTASPVTETTRRKALADAIEIVTALANIGIPSFAQDLKPVVENLEAHPEHKRAMLKTLGQWQKMQGIGEEAALMQRQAEAQTAQAQAQAQSAPSPLPANA